MQDIRKKRVTCDAFPDSPFRYLHYDAIVCIDVLRATTTLVSAVALGRRAYPANNPGHARQLADGLGDALLAGENKSGVTVFEVPNSPTVIGKRGDLDRPLVLASSVGTEIILNAAGCPAVYVACLRNIEATAVALARQHRSVAVLAACSRGQLRCEDLMAAARLSEKLLRCGFEPEDNRTVDLVNRWANADLALIRLGNSAERLLRTGQGEDVEFVIDHVDDLDEAFRFSEGEVVCGVEEAEKPRVAQARAGWRRAALVSAGEPLGVRLSAAGPPAR